MINNLLKWINNTWWVESLVISGFILILCILSYWATRRVLLSVVHFLVKKSRNQWDDYLADQKFFSRMAYLAPALVIYQFSDYLPEYAGFIERGVSLYITFIVIIVIESFLSAVNFIYAQFEMSRDRPIKGYINFAKIIIYIAGGLIMIAVALNKSPWLLLSGLGAVTAVLVLIFKDTILSLVASIKLVSNNLIQIGDWIEMPQYRANGDVIDIALHTIQVQNWDKTIVSIPTYKFLDESFINWRGMLRSGGRRIMRSIHIDLSTTGYADDELIEQLSRVSHLKNYIKERKAEIDKYNKTYEIDTSIPLNGRRLTKTGLFKAYLTRYLRAHPKVRDDMTFMVRQLEPQPQGLPVEIYVFVSETAWMLYEEVQAELFDHIIASVEWFDLKIFQQPSGDDIRSLGQILNTAKD